MAPSIKQFMPQGIVEGVVRERDSQRGPCQNHCHPRLIVGVPKAMLPPPPPRNNIRRFTLQELGGLGGGMLGR